MVLVVALSATCSLGPGAPWELGKYLWQECVNECMSGTLSGLWDVYSVTSGQSSLSSCRVDKRMPFSQLSCGIYSGPCLQAHVLLFPEALG